VQKTETTPYYGVKENELLFSRLNIQQKSNLDNQMKDDAFLNSWKDNKSRKLYEIQNVREDLE